MMLSKILFVTICFSFFFISCASEGEKVEAEKETISQFNVDWIVGNWIDTVSFKLYNQEYNEEWIKIDENKYKGKRFTVKKGDTGVVTPIVITRVGEDYFYSFDGDNDKFLYVKDSIGKNYLSFSNTKNVFPQNIIFAKISDTLVTYISGLDRNGIKRQREIKSVKTD